MKHKSKLLFIIVAALSIGIMANAQEATDKVVKRDGTTIEAIVSDISNEEIKFKKANNPTGPTYTLPVKQVKKIILTTGEEEVFETPDDPPKAVSKAIDTTPLSAQKFLVYSEDGQSIYTDLTFQDNNRYLCVWNLDLELIKKIQIPKYWNSYSQQIASNGNYLDKSVLYASDGTELRRFKRKDFMFETELSGLKYPGIVSPSGKRFLINEHASNRQDFYLYDENGKLVKNYHHTIIQNFLFSHKKDMFYIITYHVSKNPVHIEIYDSAGMAVGTVKVGSIENNMVRAGGGLEGDKVFPQFSFDDQYIITKHSYTDVVVADVKGNVIRHLYHPMANAMAFSRDGKKIATAGATYFGHSQKIEDEKGNKIDYSGGSIKIWSFEGQLLKEITFPARVDYLQFTPDNGLFVLIGDTGTCLLLSQEDDYKLPDGYEKSVEEMAKYQSEKRDNAVKDKRLAYWIDMSVSIYKALEAGSAKVQAEKNRLVAQEKKAFKLSQAIANRNNTAKKPPTFTSKSGSKGTCHFEFEIIENYTDGKLTGVSISDVYAVPPTHVTKTVSSGKSGEYVEALGAKTSSTSNLYKLFVYPSLMDATKAWQEKGQALEDKYDFFKKVTKPGQCN